MSIGLRLDDVLYQIKTEPSIVGERALEDCADCAGSAEYGYVAVVQSVQMFEDELPNCSGQLVN